MSRRRKRQSTIDERIAAIGRMIAAAGRAVAEDDPEQFAKLVALQSVLHRSIEIAVVGLRRDHTWQTIGDALGVTPQACILRWGGIAGRAGKTGPMRGNRD